MSSNCSFAPNGPNRASIEILLISGVRICQLCAYPLVHAELHKIKWHILYSYWNLPNDVIKKRNGQTKQKRNQRED